jgi:hypothetical protein
MSSDGLTSYALVSAPHDRAMVNASKDPKKGRNDPRVIATVSCRSVGLVLSLGEGVQDHVEGNIPHGRAADNEKSRDLEQET